MSREILEKEILRAMDRAKSEMVWGKDDCALWVANIIRGVLKYDPAKRFRGKYYTRLGARQALGKLGLPFAIRKSAKKHSWRSVKSSDAKPGDVGLIRMVLDDGEIVPATVICRAPGWFVGRGQRGCSLIPASKVKVAWAIL